MKQNETTWDKLLKIKTSGRDDSHSDTYHYPYEPTPYSVLERLANSGYIEKGEVLIDYGCGKGRVDFFLPYQMKCHCIGIEFDERLFQQALENKCEYARASYVRFVNGLAQEYQVGTEVTCFYFFNPFSVEILQKVMGRIRESYYEEPREMKLFFYYPSDEYIGYLMGIEELTFLDEIACADLFEGNNPRERIMIFTIE